MLIQNVLKQVKREEVSSWKLNLFMAVIAVL